jgi:uncharacterized membrane protein YphA (DoxX/SURF4 family)
VTGRRKGARPAREAPLQRFFTTFPNGLPGAGLLLLRVALGGLLVAGGLSALARADAGALLHAFAVASLIGGCALLGGALTPAAGTLAVLIGVALVAAPESLPEIALPGTAANLLVLVMAGAIVLLGPGGFSVDALVFGRREIAIPRRPADPPGD